MKNGLLVAAVVLLLLMSLTAFGQSTPEFRSVEATAWGSAFESAGATTAYVNYVRSINANCIIPELRLRCDAYYISSIEPPGTGVAMTPGYDPLADCIAKAHALGMEVHPWAVTFRIWTTVGGPGAHYSPIDHMWWTHGPGRPPGADDWLMYGETGGWDYGGFVNLDPGHPAVEDYLIAVFMEMVNNYDLDGLNLDYIRYPSTSWGYNPVSVARFNAEYGRTGSPSAGDATWQQWRRDQVTNLVKRLYLEIKAVKPHVKLSADVWNLWSTGNASYLQDWDKWMQNHWIDFVHPMTYTSNNSTFHGWMDDAMNRQYGRHVYPLVTASNSIEGNVLPQIDLVREHGFSGLGLYSYQGIPDKPGLQAALLGSSYFPTFVQPAGMPWLDTPTIGYVKGFVKDQNANVLYPATVTVTSSGASTKDTGTGFYGFVDLAPGTYSIRATAAYHDTVTSSVTITAGQCATLNFTLPAETTPPVITNVRATNLQGTNALIQWDTDEAATSQVDYGPAIPYANTTAEDMARVTAHSIQLIGLATSTTYHYRVRSYDAVRNMAQSTDYTFSTTAGDAPADIIIDNTDARCTTTGTWFSSGFSAYKYGTNFLYVTNAGGTMTATWRPTILTPGNYNVYAWWVGSAVGGGRTTLAPFKVQWNGGTQTIICNQQDTATGDGHWRLIKAAAPFAVGTAGYVQVTNTGIEASKTVCADAVKFEFVDATPPTPPSNLTASAIAAGQMSLSWTGSTDNIGVTGYKVYRNDVLIQTVTSNSYLDTGLDPNTSYSYYVKATDAAGNLSGPSNTVTKYSLSVAPGASSVTCDKPVDTWQTTATFTFTAAGGFGAGEIQYYRYAWTLSSSHSWTGFETQWSSSTLPLQATGGSWYLHVKGFNADNVENGNYTYGPFKYDGTTVQITNLNDGKYVDATGQLQASWSGSDPESGVTEYQYAIGTSPEDLTSVRGWTTTGTSASVTTTGLTLVANTKYIFAVKALNGAGAWSDPVVSDGVTAATTVASISEAKILADGSAIILADRVVSANFGTFFYICDDKTDLRVSAIRVEGTSAIEGDLTDVSGILQSPNGERVITEPDTSPESGPGTPAPMLTSARNVGGGELNGNTPGITDGFGVNNMGVLVTVTGRVKDPDAGYFMVEDGGTLVSRVKVSTLMLTDIPGVDKFVTITGIVSTEKSGGVVTPIIIPRGDGDAPKPWYD